MSEQNNQLDQYPIPPSLLESEYSGGLSFGEWMIVGVLLLVSIFILQNQRHFEALSWLFLPVGAYLVLRRWYIKGAYVNAAHQFMVMLRYYGRQPMFILRRELQLPASKEVREIEEDESAANSRRVPAVSETECSGREDGV